jgi:nucleolar protein TMA23
MTLAKRETARRGLYSRFFRGPVLGPDPEAGDPPAPEAVNQSTPSRTESNGSEHSTSITEKRNRKRKCLEVGETGIVQKRRKQEGRDGIKDERNKRRLQNPKKAAEKGEDSEIKSDGCVETRPPKTLDPSEGLAHGDGGVGHSRKKDHKKKRKRKHKDKESVAHHDD